MESISGMDLCRYTCAVLTGSQYLLGIGFMVQMCETNSTKHVPFMVFLINAVSCTGFLQYGWVVDDTTTMVLNFVGLIHWLYIAIHLLIVPERQKDKSIGGFFIAMILSLASVFVNKTVYIRDKKLEHILEAIIRSGRAIAILKHAKRDTLPYAMLVLGIFSTVIRFIYGCFLDNPYVIVPYVAALFVKLMVLFGTCICADEERHRMLP